MKRATTVTALMLAGLFLMPSPAWAVSKEIIQLQQSVQLLSDQVRDLTRLFTEKMAVMSQLVEKTSDANNRLQGSIDTVQRGLQTAIQSQTVAQNQKIDAQSTRLQQISDNVDDLKARQAKLSEQITQLRQLMETIQAQPPVAPPVATQQPVQATPAPAPVPPQTLYENALKDMLHQNSDQAMAGFQEYLKNYPTEERAENAQFYVGEIYYSNGQYAKAVDCYTKVIDGFPKGNKAPAAHLKKGYALVELRQKAAATKEFNVLIRRFPSSQEAKRAKERLKSL